MMSNDEKLVYMLNQIARNFEALGHRRAVEATADHIASFWDPRMRARIMQLTENGSSPLGETARAAIDLLKQRVPAPQTRATVFASVDEPGRSDAG